MSIGTQITIGLRLQSLKLAEVGMQVLTYNYGCRPIGLSIAQQL